MKQYICPKCGIEMEKGEFRIGGGTAFGYYVPDSEALPVLLTNHSVKKHRIVRLRPFTNKEMISLDPDVPDAWICRNCKLLLVDCDGPDLTS